MKVDADLAPMERRVFRLFVLEGATNMAIAEELERSESAIKQHMTRLLKKFGCDRREELLVRFYQHVIARVMNDVVGVETNLEDEAQLTRDVEGLMVQMFDGEDTAMGLVFAEDEEAAVPLKTSRKRGKKPSKQPSKPSSKATAPKDEAPEDTAPSPPASEAPEVQTAEPEPADTAPSPPVHETSPADDSPAAETPPVEEAPAAPPPPKRKTILRKRSAQSAPAEPARAPLAPPPIAPPASQVSLPLSIPPSTPSVPRPPAPPPPTEISNDALSQTQTRIILMGLEGPIGFGDAPRIIGSDFGPQMHRLVLAGLFERLQGNQHWALTDEGRERAEELKTSSDGR